MAIPLWLWITAGILLVLVVGSTIMGFLVKKLKWLFLLLLAAVFALLIYFSFI
jgi:hypothetical protein